MKNKTPWKYALLLSGLGWLSAGLPSAAVEPAQQSERPRPESYASYSQYLQALYDYQQKQDRREAANNDCGGQQPRERDREWRHDDPRQRDPRYGAGSPCYGNSSDDQQQGQGLGQNGQNNGANQRGPDQGQLGNIQEENLDAAIEQAARGDNPGYVDTSDNPRTTSSNFPLTQLTSSDLGTLGVNGLLGIFNQATQSGGGSSVLNNSLGLNGGGGLTLEDLNSETDTRTDVDVTDILNSIARADFQALGNLVFTPNVIGDTQVSAFNTRNGLGMDLSTNVDATLYIVDRDGYPSDPVFYHAGDYVLSNFGLDTNNLIINMQGVNSSGSTGDLLLVNSASANPITLNLSGTEVGAADAVVSGAKVGTPLDFLRLGLGSLLTIAGGAQLTMAITPPDGSTSPFATINGQINDISLDNSILLDSPDAGNLTIGHMELTGLTLVNTQIFFQGESILLNTGLGMNNMSLGLERVSIDSSSSVGDFYVQHMDYSNNLIRLAPH